LTTWFFDGVACPIQGLLRMIDTLWWLNFYAVFKVLTRVFDSSIPTSFLTKLIWVLISLSFCGWL